MKIGEYKATITGFHNRATDFQKQRAVKLFGDRMNETRVFPVYKIEGNGNFCYSFNDYEKGSVCNVCCFKSLDGLVRRIREHYTPFGYAVKLEWVEQ